jgi:hypothetical protein
MLVRSKSSYNGGWMRSFSNEVINQCLQMMFQECASLCYTPMHTILPDLLLYSYYTELLSAKYLGIDLLFGSFSPCPSG